MLSLMTFCLLEDEANPTRSCGLKSNADAVLFDDPCQWHLNSSNPGSCSCPNDLCNVVIDLPGPRPAPGYPMALVPVCNAAIKPWRMAASALILFAAAATQIFD